MKRRDFVRTSMNAGMAPWTAASADRVFGANERLRVGLVRCGGRGTFDARLIRGTPEDIQTVAPANYHNGNLDPRLAVPRDVEIAASAMCYESRVTAAKRWAPRAKAYDDFRSLLADKDIDAVMIATQDQVVRFGAHPGLPTPEKDVYLEELHVMCRLCRKLTAMIEAVRHNQRIVHSGTRRRSAECIAEAARNRPGEVSWAKSAFGVFGIT